MAYETKLIEAYPGFGPDATTDGSMEDDPVTNWPAASGPGATVVETTIVHGGEKSIKFTAAGANDYISQNIMVIPEQRYRILAWGYSSAAGHRWRVRIYDTVPAVRWTGDWHDNAAWEREEKFYRIPAGVTTIQLRLEIETNGEIVYFDDVTVRQEAPVIMSEIDLMFRATDDWSLLQQGIRINDPRIVEIWGGELEDQLVRRAEGKRVIPMELNLESADADTLIEDVNGLEEMLRHGAAYRTEGKRSGYGEVFVQFKTGDATYSVWYPVLCGQIDKAALMKACGSDKLIDKVPVVIICEAYWEADNTYGLNNYFDNPAFWRGATPPGDHWAKLADPAANLVLEWDRERFVFMCRSLKMIFSHDNVNNLGVASGTATMRGETEFYWELRGFHPAGCDDIRASIWDLTGAPFEIAASVMVFDNQDDAWETLGTTFTTTAGNRTLVAYVRRMAIDSTAGDKEFWIDALYADEGAIVPTGWCSGKDLVNHLDDGAHINVLCVAEIPGEVEAEMRFDVEIADECEYLHIAKRTRNEPCGIQWQLLPCEAYTDVENHVGCQPGLTDPGIAIDSDKEVDAASPCGCRIHVDFVNLAMNNRAYWEITNNLPNYYGKWMLGILCDVTGTTDTIKMKVFVYQDIQNWGQGYVLEQTVPNAPAGEWELLSGWQILSFPVGTHDDDLWDASNRWRIEVHASSTGTTDDLWIAGAYLIPLDDGYFIGGDPTFSGGVTMSIVDLDGERGVFPHYSNYRLSNVGGVGKYPSLTPEIENYFYFILSEWGDHVIANTMEVSLKYRPRGIFLRGTNP